MREMSAPKIKTLVSKLVCGGLEEWGGREQTFGRDRDRFLRRGMRARWLGSRFASGTK